MLRRSWFIATRDLGHMLRARETILWLFIMPILFIYFIGTITSRFGRGEGPGADVLVLQAPDEAGFLVDRIARYLEANDYRVIRRTSESEPASRLLAIPAGFTGSVLAGNRVKLHFTNSESGLSQDYHTIRVGRAIYTALADVVAVAQAGEAATPEAFEKLDRMPRNVTLEVQPAGERQEVPTGFEQAITGIMVMFTLIVLLTSGSIQLVVERRQGLLRRLASSPIPVRSITLGKWLARLILGLVQIAFAMLVGSIIFGMD